MKVDMAETAPETTQAQSAYRRIEEMIVTLALAPGSRISESSIAQQLGMGRTPVREAMQRLAREGSLSILPRAGAIVSEIDITDQFKLIELRREVERVVIGRAARLANAEARQQFCDLRDRFLKAAEVNDDAGFMAADREFNAAIVATADNKYATTVMGPIQAQTRRFWYLNFSKFGELGRVAAAHAQIADAVASNDETRARESSDALIDYVEEYTMKTLQALL